MPGTPMRNFKLPAARKSTSERADVHRHGAERLVGVDVEQRAVRVRARRRARAMSCMNPFR